MQKAIAVVLGVASSAFATNPVFEVSFDASLQSSPAFGRLVVYLMHDGGKRGPGASPADGPFPDDPQPMYGVSLKSLAPGAVAQVDDNATSFPVKLGKLPAGPYIVQAVLDMHHDNSSW